MIPDKLIIFDIDGTLLYSNKIDSKCFANTFEKRYGQPFPSIDWTYFSHVTDHVIFREAYKDVNGVFPSAAEIEFFKTEFVESLEKARKLNPTDFNIVPGALELFAYLREKNIPFALGTGGWETPATVKLKHVGLWFDEIVLSGADNQNSREDIITTAKARGKAKGMKWGSEAYIGDAVWDVKTCRNMQLPLLGIKLKGDHERLLSIGASHVITDYTDQGEFFEKIASCVAPV